MYTDISQSVWDNYERISDKHAPKIIKAVRTEKDSNMMQTKIDEIRLDIELEAFGITYERQGQGQKQKEIQELNGRE